MTTPVGKKLIEAKGLSYFYSQGLGPAACGGLPRGALCPADG